MTNCSMYRLERRRESSTLSRLPSKDAVLDLDAGIAVVADVGQRRYVAAPVHIAQAGQLRGSCSPADRPWCPPGAGLLGEELDILVMDVENLVA